VVFGRLRPYRFDMLLNLNTLAVSARTPCRLQIGNPNLRKHWKTSRVWDTLTIATSVSEALVIERSPAAGFADGFHKPHLLALADSLDLIPAWTTRSI